VLLSALSGMHQRKIPVPLVCASTLTIVSRRAVVRLTTGPLSPTESESLLAVYPSLAESLAPVASIFV
jgi:hypothetical protein